MTEHLNDFEKLIPQNGHAYYVMITVTKQLKSRQESQGSNYDKKLERIFICLKILNVSSQIPFPCCDKKKAEFQNV